jgi:2-isopropylmalate synthase
MSSSALRTIHFSDTTLRDGEQMPRAALTPDQKVRLAHALAELGVASIDAGFPACAPSEVAAIQRIVREVEGPSISALCRTLPGDIDLAWEALGEAAPDKRSVSLFVGTSPSHRDHKLRKDVTALLHTVRNAIEHARQRFPIVAFSPEDASRTEPDVLCEFYKEAIDAGARVVGFPDTVGVLMPAGVRRAIRMILDTVPNIGKAKLAGHFHNDLGLATANTLAAIEEGVSIVQGTITGIGERAGNTSLEEVAMAIALHGEEMGVQQTLHLEKLWSAGRLVAELTGIPLAANKPVIGANVFATEAGIHQDGLLKHPDTYLPFRPERVGAPGIELVLGKHSGRAAFHARLTELGYAIDDELVDRVAAFAKEADKREWSDDASLLARAVGHVQASAGK